MGWAEGGGWGGGGLLVFLVSTISVTRKKLRILSFHIRLSLDSSHPCEKFRLFCSTREPKRSPRPVPGPPPPTSPPSCTLALACEMSHLQTQNSSCRLVTTHGRQKKPPFNFFVHCKVPNYMGLFGL
jgi:hypothetical protein